MIVGDASESTITNNTSERPSADTDKSPKNSGQAKMQSIQIANIVTQRVTVSGLNGLQSL